MSKRKTTEQFVQEAQLVHGNKYDYSKVDYKGKDVKVIIICKEHGEFLQRPHNHLKGQGCPKCSGRYMSTDYFKEKASKIHNGKYNYDKVQYKSNTSKVVINCPIHGDFKQTPHEHLSGNGCQKCKSEVYKNKNIFNNDMFFMNEKDSYKKWRQMIKRCGNPKYPTYKDCVICEDWHTFSNYEKWHNEHYVEGWHLDKDILVKGNKTYSPDTCSFVPKEINNLFIKCGNIRGDLPIGVKRGSNCKFYAQISKNVKTYLGSYNTLEEAFQAYKVAKEMWIKEVANKYKDKLEPRVYNALMKYEVEITD